MFIDDQIYIDLLFSVTSAHPTALHLSTLIMQIRNDFDFVLFAWYSNKFKQKMELNQMLTSILFFLLLVIDISLLYR